MIRLPVFLFILYTHLSAADWPQGSGPNSDFSTQGTAVTTWSAVQSKNILWRKTLPETGQSTVVIQGRRAFFTTMDPVTQDSELGSNIECWCVDADNGDTIWKRPVKGEHPLRLSGCFSDSSSPPPVTNGKSAVFTNASGTITAFDLEGELLWKREMLTVGRTQPFLYNDTFVVIRQVYQPQQGKFGHDHKNAPLSEWTQLVGLDFATGEDKWATTCGVNMGCVPLLQKLSDGTPVAVVGRGGGHSPPEKPEGISLVNLDTGGTIWSLELPGFMATQTYTVREDTAFVFHGSFHYSIDALTGQIVKKTPVVGEVTLCAWTGTGYEVKRVDLSGSEKRNITQQSNLVAGDFHYFRCYTKNWLGRINLKTDEVEYLELPLQLKRNSDGTEELLHMPNPPPTYKDKKGKLKPLPFNQIAFTPNDMKNSRGLVVVGDARSRYNGWGHYSSVVPTLIGANLYIPTMSGTVFVIAANAQRLNGDAVVAINDLGPVGEAWNRASLSFAHDRIYAHTIKEILCIGK
ncbi:MAG: PQQ-binding-like beta-propeller repeat protein [Verrucomicrobiales bacterium]|nr:PQQ-binding-like beta-propeller repeat protein [Verrucomicrobiales bacterium]